MRPLAPAAAVLAHETNIPKLGLTLLDRLAATALTGPDVPDVEEETRRSAAALAVPDIEAARAARRRLAARLIAIERTTLTVALGMLGEHVRAGLGDQHALRVARLLDGLANSANLRLTRLLEAAEPRAAALSIGNAVIVEAAE